MSFHDWIIVQRSKRPSHERNPFAILETVFDDNEIDCSADRDADAFNKWITKERRHKSKSLDTDIEQFDAALDRFISVVEHTEEGHVYILRVSRSNLAIVARIIGEFLSMSPSKIKRTIRRDYPAVFNCATQENADLLREQLDPYCVCL